MQHYVTTVRMSDGSVVKLECHDSLPSTAHLAREYARMGYPDRYVVFSEKQTRQDSDGRSRGSVERGIFMSCILRPSIFPSQAGLLSSLSAVAMVSALEEHTTRNIGIGWVSKIYCDGKMIGDVTIEGKLDSFASYEFLIVTFSAVLGEEEFPPRLTDLIRKVFESENTSISMIIAKNILDKFFPLYANIKNNTKFMDTYRKKFILRGHRVRYQSGGRRQSCKVLGVDQENGTLMVENSEKKIVYISTPNSVTVPKRVKLGKRSSQNNKA